MWNFDIAMQVLTCACEALHWSIPFNTWKIWHSYVRIPCHYVKFIALPGHKYDIAMSHWYNHTYRCALQHIKAKFDGITSNASFHLVPLGPKDVTIDYRLTRPDNERTKEAYGDSVDRKRFRIGEMYAFMHLARYLLNTTSVPYIGINQEDVMLNYRLVLRPDKLLKTMFRIEIWRWWCITST
jgi:hypothetical protein